MADQSSKQRAWTLDEIRAYGRDDVPALLAMERGVAADPLQGPDRDPLEKSDDSWHEPWLAEVAAKQRATYDLMRHG